MRTVLALVLSAVAAVPVAAQSVDELCSTLQKVQTGQWAEYRMTNREMGDQPIQIRMALVGEESVNGTRHYWYEMKMGGPQGNMIMQLLVPEWPYDADQIAGMVMKAGDQPAMRMPDQMIGMMAQRAPGAALGKDALKECRAAQIVGRERVTVPAGSFDAVHIRSADGPTDLWASADLPFGVIRMQRPGMEMVLLGHGMDAKSSITETPQRM